MDPRGTSFLKVVRPNDSQPDRGVRDFPMDHHRQPYANPRPQGPHIQANSIKVRMTLAQVVQPAVPQHHPLSLDTLGRGCPL